MRAIDRDHTGKTVGRLKVICKTPGSESPGRSKWLCECYCSDGWVRLTVVDSWNIHAGKTRSCGCFKADMAREKINRGRRPVLFSAEDGARRKAIKSYKWAAADRGLSWEITDEQFYEISSRPCHYCGALPNNKGWKKVSSQFVYSGIDRVDNSIGYEFGNCVPCCKTCNYAKREMSLQEFKMWIGRVFRNQIAKAVA